MWPVCLLMTASGSFCSYSCFFLKCFSPALIFSQLCKELPPRTVGHTWQLAYSTSRHGASLKSLYRKLSTTDSPVLIVIKDALDEVKHTVDEVKHTVVSERQGWCIFEGWLRWCLWEYFQLDFLIIAEHKWYVVFRKIDEHHFHDFWSISAITRSKKANVRLWKTSPT